jgi:hypothetical protein
MGGLYPYVCRLAYRQQLTFSLFRGHAWTAHQPANRMYGAFHAALKPQHPGTAGASESVVSIARDQSISQMVGKNSATTRIPKGDPLFPSLEFQVLVRTRNESADRKSCRPDTESIALQNCFSLHAPA